MAGRPWRPSLCEHANFLTVDSCCHPVNHRFLNTFVMRFGGLSRVEIEARICLGEDILFFFFFV